MKKIGILFGMENTFPQAFIDRVNEKGLKDIKAEAVSIEMVEQAKPTDYAVIIDRISQDVPFYRAYLKNAALSGTAVINNPFWWSADESSLITDWQKPLVFLCQKPLFYRLPIVRQTPQKHHLEI